MKKELIEKIDYLVRIGRYPNRSAAIREIIEEKLADKNYFI
ncbi:MAG: ribbon-helix-helix domain-containing protein, partial [Candidatus Helarchaeota archaeon]